MTKGWRVKLRYCSLVRHITPPLEISSPTSLSITDAFVYKYEVSQTWFFRNMANSLRETLQLRDVLLSLTQFVTGAKETIVAISTEGKGADRHARKKLQGEGKSLDKALEIASALILFYECKLAEEADASALRRHIDDAKVLCDAIRTMRSDQRECIRSDPSNHPTLQSSSITHSGQANNNSAPFTYREDSEAGSWFWSDDGDTVCGEASESEQVSIGSSESRKKVSKLSRFARTMSMPLRRSSTLVAGRLPCISETREVCRAN